MRRYPLLLSTKDLDALVALEGRQLTEDECFAEAQEMSSDLRIQSSNRFQDRSWGWIPGFVAGFMTSKIDIVYPENFVLIVASFLTLSGLIVAAVQWRPLRTAIETNVEVSWVAGLFMQSSAPITPTPWQNTLAFEFGESIENEAGGHLQKDYVCLGHGIDTSDLPDLMPLDNLTEISLQKRGLIFRSRRRILQQLHHDIVPDLFALGALFVTIALCLPWTNSEVESTAGMSRLAIGLFLGRLLSSLARIASRWFESRQTWKRQVVFERLFVAAIAGVPSTALRRLVTRFLHRGDLVFATAERIEEERLKGHIQTTRDYINT